MKARPILFSAPMILALLAGRKTQTRRVLKLPRGCSWYDDLGGEAAGWWVDDGSPAWFHIDELRCPHGRPGDLLWVRETWMEPPHDPERFRYRVTNPSYAGKWRPSIFMPRDASRLTLRLTEVRVERLQEISEADAIAEGLIEWSDPPRITAKHYGLSVADVWETKASVAYARIWNSINGPDSWAANPWVWALTFEVIKQNVDDFLKVAA